MDQARQTPRDEPKDEPKPDEPKPGKSKGEPLHERNPHRNTIKRIQNFDLYDGYT